VRGLPQATIKEESGGNNTPNDRNQEIELVVLLDLVFSQL